MIPDYLKPVLEADAEAYIKRLTGWPYAGMATEANRWAQRKFHLACEIWEKRSAQCPGVKNKYGQPMTWAERFAEMFHEPLEDYVARVRAAREERGRAA